MPSTTITNSIASYLITSSNLTLTNLGTIGTSAAYGVAVTGTGDTVLNSGIVRGQTFGVTASTAVVLTNSVGALIYGGTTGVYADATTSITNAGSIGGGNEGVRLKAG